MFQKLKSDVQQYSEITALRIKFVAGVGFFNRQISRGCDISEDKARFVAQVQDPMDAAYAGLSEANKVRFWREVTS